MAEAFQTLIFPLAGTDRHSAFGVQRPGTTATGQNVRAQDPATGSLRGGNRPGLARYVTQQLPTAAVIQELALVVDPIATALLAEYNDENWTVLDPSTNPPGSVYNDPTTGFRNPGRATRTDGTTNGTGIQPSRNEKKTPEINWAEPGPIQEGTALSGTQLNATATDPVTDATVAGSFVYNPASGTVLSLGDNQVLRCTFTPTDTNTYRTAYGRTTIDVQPTVIAFVQGKIDGSTTFGSGTQFTAAFNSNCTAGNGLILVVYLNYDYASVQADPNPTVTVSDSRGNTWVQAGTYVRADIDPILTAFPGSQTSWWCCLSLWYAANCAAGSTTVTVNHSSGYTITEHGYALAEYSGLHTTSPLRSFASGTLSGTDNTASPAAISVSTGSITASSSDLIIATTIVNLDSSSHAPTNTSFLERLYDSSPYKTSFADRCPSSGSDTCTWLGYSPIGWVALGASFKPA